MIVRTKESENAMNALNRGYFVAIALSIIGLAITVYFMLNNWWLFAAGMVGIVASVVIIYVTQYYTESRYKPVQDIAEASKTGPATNIVMGIAVGFETTFATAIVIGVALILAYWFGTLSGVQGGPAFGTAVATMGMLMTCPYVLSMDTFGPITDNANGINEMAGAGKEIRKITDRLDAVGNTTKALTKGYAMVSSGEELSIQLISLASTFSLARCLLLCWFSCSAHWQSKQSAAQPAKSSTLSANNSGLIRVLWPELKNLTMVRSWTSPPRPV
jgi:K(+)-stimulated pyrophosphate-energized sodium pump